MARVYATERMHGFGEEAVLSLFIQFLCAHKGLSPGRVVEYGQRQPASRERFGAIALRLGQLTPAQVDEILTAKRRLERFGETAARLRYLTAEEVERVLLIQSLQDLTDFTAWALVQGTLQQDDYVKTLAEFWTWVSERERQPWKQGLGKYLAPIENAASRDAVAATI